MNSNLNADYKTRGNLICLGSTMMIQYVIWRVD